LKKTISMLAALSAALYLSTACVLASNNTPISNSQAPLGWNLSVQAQDELRALIAGGNLSDLRWPDFVDFRDQVFTFYQAGAYSLAWFRDSKVTPQAVAMIELFKTAAQNGLSDEDYDGPRWDARLEKMQTLTSPQSPEALIRFDLALTVCAMRYISALRLGRVNPRHFKFGLDVGPKEYDLTDFLRNQVIYSPNVKTKIDQLEPTLPGYQRAKAALATYVKLAEQGDADSLSVPRKTIHPGDTYQGIPQLLSRLRQLGDLGSVSDRSEHATTYTDPVVDAVRRFQTRHGLEPDGLLDRRTISELNTPLRVRVQQLQLALERYRWIPTDFPHPPIVVNIPEFRLRTARATPILDMRVVVGKAYRHQTPVFASYIRYIVFRPYWEVPRSIQLAELIPKIQRDRNYLASDDFEVVDRGGSLVTDGTVSDTVLAALRAGTLSIRQKPGPKNSLGLIKFMFPNSFNVYLHGTPEPRLFSRPRRDFSHGCIRVQDPVALAAWLLRDKPEWTVDQILTTMNGEQTVQVNLDRPVPVLILYSTAVVEPNGETHFFDDIYGDDASLEKVLSGGYPYPN
jgi:L,D-transpeptidase YcbB